MWLFAFQSLQLKKALWKEVRMDAEGQSTYNTGVVARQDGETSDKKVDESSSLHLPGNKVILKIQPNSRESLVHSPDVECSHQFRNNYFPPKVAGACL